MLANFFWPTLYALFKSETKQKLQFIRFWHFNCSVDGCWRIVGTFMQNNAGNQVLCSLSVSQLNFYTAFLHVRVASKSSCDATEFLPWFEEINYFAFLLLVILSLCFYVSFYLEFIVGIQIIQLCCSLFYDFVVWFLATGAFESLKGST